MYDSVTQREDWLRERKGYIGASDLSAILGENPYTTPLQVYMTKLGLLEDEAPTQAMKRGIRLEPVIAEMYTEATGSEVTKAAPIRHGTKRHLGVNPDYEVRHSRYIECKSHLPWVAHHYGPPGTDEAPSWEIIQAQWQCHLGEWDQCDIAVMIGLGDDDFRIYNVEYDPEFGAMLEARADAFWRDNILAQVPPEVAAADTDLLKRLYPFDRGATVYATPEIEEHCRALGPATEAVKAATLAKDAHVAAIQQHMGDAAYLEWSGGKPFSWRTGKGSPRYKDLAEYLGATAAQVEQFRGKEKRTFLSPWSRG